MYQVSYERSYYYPTTEDDITLQAELRLAQEGVEAEAKLDTGAAFCLFKRSYAEQLGLVVEQGYRQRFGTLTDSFTAYGYTLMLKTLEIELEVLVFFPADIVIPRNLLGRNWLRRVRLGLVEYEGLLFLSKYDQEI